VTVSTADARELGNQALQGWRKKVADAAAPRLAERTRAREQDVRAAFGLVFLALTVRHLVVTLRHFASSRRESS
jgi:hypothetical protein